ncbi:hypothetical protein ACNO7T_08840 [Vibrio campbellii]
MTTYSKLESRPDPHPIDSDWRFAYSSIEKLANILTNKKNVLLIGTPSLAYRLLDLGLNFTLVDRQKIVGIPNQINADIGVSKPENGVYDAVVIDAPWYEHELLRWISWASQIVGTECKIYSTLWPENTRPNACTERGRVFDWLRSWSKCELIEDFLMYDSPYFESVAKKHNADFSSEKTWFHGDLLIIEPFQVLKLLPSINRQYSWKRYTIGNLQLAIREDDLDIAPEIGLVEGADGWVWPHISKRAEGRDTIGMWSSDNRVATLNGSKRLISILDAYLGMHEIDTLNDPCDNIEYFYNVFTAWSIPRNCADRVIKWTSQD